jgi:RimJ/RimL family protein N-acetyltransferase
MDLPVPDQPLTDGVVMLRPPADRDLAAIEEGIQDPEVIRWFGQPTLSPSEVLEMNRAWWANGTGATYAICDADDRCIGHIWVNLREARRGSVGYWLLRDARGRGLATRSVRLICDWAFRVLGLARLQLLTEPSNDASQRVAERAGSRREGVLRSNGEVDGRRVDHVVFSLLPGDRASSATPMDG